MTIEQIQKNLSAAYGFVVPYPFAQILHHTYQSFIQDENFGYSEEDEVDDYMSSDFGTYYDFMFDWISPVNLSTIRNGNHKRSIRQYAIAPEFFEFAATGMDGITFGLLVHAPELGATDYPIARSCPDDEPYVWIRGLTVASGFESVLSEVYGYWKYDVYYKENPPSKKRKQQAETLAQLLDIVPQAAEFSALKRDWVVPAPAGWRYEPSSDGVGVLAPASLFAPNQENIEVYGDDWQATMKMACTYLEQNYPATALLALREAYIKNWFEESILNEIAPLWIQVYHALGRPLLAEAVQKQVDLSSASENNSEEG